MDDALLLAKQAELKALETEVLGMFFDNQDRLRNDEALAWPSSIFRAYAADMRSLAEYIMKNR